MEPSASLAALLRQHMQRAGYTADRLAKDCAYSVDACNKTSAVCMALAREGCEVLESLPSVDATSSHWWTRPV